jgi:Leucine-rich repeat (LRR) protein
MLVIFGLVAGLRADAASSPDGGSAAASTRILHFPQDQCMGRLSVEDPQLGSSYLELGRDLSLPLGLAPKMVCLGGNSDFVGLAQGDVVVPAGRNIQLITLLQPRQEDFARLSPLKRKFLRNRLSSDPEDLSGLSELGPNDLYKLRVSSMLARADADRRVLAPISHLTGLQILTLSETGITNEQMKYLKPLRALRALELSREFSIGNAGMAVLKDLPALEYLDLDTEVTDAGLKHVGQLPNLRWLRIRTGRIYGLGLAELANLPRLERLCIWGTSPISDRHIKYLEGLTQLKSLTLWGIADRLTDASLASIGKLKNLEELHFIMTGPKFTSGGIAHLRRLKYLRKIDLGFMHISDAQYLMALPQLEFIKSVDLTVENMKALSSLRKLKSLGVFLPSLPNGSTDDPVAASQLGTLSSLEELSFCGSVAGRFVSDEEVARLESLVRLKKLLLGGSNHLTDRSLTSISKLDQLESLDFSVFDNAGVTKKGLKQLSGLTNLHTLDVKVHPAVKGPADGVTLDFSALTKLNTLTLDGLPLQDADLASLAGLHHLEWLVLGGDFTEEGLFHLKNLPELKRFSISSITCTAGDHLSNLGGLKKLEDLTLRGRITDAALRRMSGLGSIWSFKVETNEPVWPETIARLKQVMPAVTYIHIEKPQRTMQPAIRQSRGQRERTRISQPRTNRRAPANRRRERR